MGERSSATYMTEIGGRVRAVAAVRAALGPAETRMVIDTIHRLKEEGVQIHYNTELDEIIGKRGRVAGVRPAEELQIISLG